MKVLVTLKHPNIDLIADIQKAELEAYFSSSRPNLFVTLENAAIGQWLSEYVKIIPFQAAEDCKLVVPQSNIAMILNADKEFARIHDEEMKLFIENKDSEKLVSKTEFLKLKEEKSNKLKEAINKSQ